MFKGLANPVMIFVVAIVATSFLFGGVQFEWGAVDFFQKHNFLFLVFVSFFPRMTLLFSSVPFGGFIWWLGFFFMPRLLVAVLATLAYGKTNPLLVGIAWVVAISGEVLEKKKLSGSKRFTFRTFSSGGNPWQRPSPQSERPREATIDKSGVIEAEFTRKE